MTIKKGLSEFINYVLSIFNLRIIKNSDSIDKYESKYKNPSYLNTPLPQDIKGKLSRRNKRLIELKNKYDQLNYPVTEHSFWSEKTLNSDELQLQYFRGDNVYLWQYRSVGSSAELKYILYTYYIKSIDKLNIFDRLSDDELFGVYTFNFNNQYTISRDLLDSINEIYFIENNIGISNNKVLNILDIGAGYGRLAHRLMQVFGNEIDNYVCTDAVAESTYICDFYLKFRNVSPKASSVPLFDIEKTLANIKIDLALNIHSFTECTYSAIEWWIELVRRNNIKYLFIVPNPNKENLLLTSEKNENGINFKPLIESYGYELKIYEPKFKDTSLQAILHHLPVFYYLFELKI